MTDQRQINELTARLAKLETLLQNNDAYSPPGAVKLADMDLGPGLDLSVPDMTQFMNQAQPDIQWVPEFSSEQQQLQQDENFGFGPTDSTITDLQQRINDLETFVAGGSNDTNQSDALDAGADAGDDGATGTGEPPAPTAVSLGLGTMAYQNYNAVAITGGSISALTNAAVTWTFTTMALTASSTATITATTTASLEAATVNVGTGSGVVVNIGTNGATIAVGGFGASTSLGSTSGSTTLRANVLNINASQMGFFNSTGASQVSVTGSRGGNAALASLLSALGSQYNLIIDNTTA